MVLPWPLLCLGLVLWAARLHGDPRTAPRVQLSFKELLQTGTARPLNFMLNTSDFRILMMDQDQDRMYLGTREYVVALDMHNINKEPLIIHWPASEFRRDECRMAGKGRDGECANYVRLIERWNRTHLYTCGTGAFNPACTFVHRGWRSEDYIFRLVPGQLESGKGKCPYDPREESMAALINGNLYAGVHIDFMGMDAALFRSLGNRPAIRTEQYDSRWLHDPIFLRAQVIPDSAERTDDKLYFFFRERSTEAGSGQFYSRVGRVCLNDSGGKRSLVNKWTSFLKARLVCSVGGVDDVETHFDQLGDVFIQPSQDEKNPLIFGVFSTSGSVFRGTAVCVYSMMDIRTVFNGPFAHKEGLNYQWVPYSGKVPYPRPGACPGGSFTPGMGSTGDYPDEVTHFIRSHPLMYNPVYPLHRQPLVIRTNVGYKFTTIAVDQVDAVDGRYPVLFLGTDRGTVQKVIVLPKGDQEIEELTLEEVQVFRHPAAVRTMKISSKRQQLYVSSDVGVTQLTLHRCARYGLGCADCCLARDPYCAWDGQACSRYTPTLKRRSRRQDVRHGDPLRQCRGYNMKVSRMISDTVQFGVEGSSTFLECRPRSPRATTKWLVQQDRSARRKLLRRDKRFLKTDHGLLVRSLELRDTAIYHCVTTENSFSHTAGRVDLRVLDRAAVHAASWSPGPEPPGEAPPAGGSPPEPHAGGKPPRLQTEAGAINQYCQDYWLEIRRSLRPKRAS
ncbi:sema domain, immunoglobulin domain (Ig), short basic domain, secreted, (semaphorin) 3Gb [Cetorhinus maximus]